MVYNFELIDNFLRSSQQRASLFWDTVRGTSEKSEMLSVIGFFLLVYLLIMPVINLFLKIKSHSSLHFIGMGKLSLSLPDVFSIVLNISLWVSYFLLSAAIIFTCFKTINYKAGIAKKAKSQRLAELFSPAETTTYSALRVSEELDKYAKAAMPSDMGMGADLDWIEGKCYSVITGKRLTGQYSGHNIISNSFFVELKNEDDVLRRLNLYKWYPEGSVEKDGIVAKLFRLRDFIFKEGFWREYSLGVRVYKSIAQTFLAAHLGNKDAFRESLDQTLVLYEQYCKTKRPLKGIPHYTVLFTPKIILLVTIVCVLTILAIGVFLLPKWIAIIVDRKFGLHWKVDDVKEVFQNFLLVLGLFLAFLWRK